MLKLVSDLNLLLCEIGKCDDEEDTELILSISFKGKLKSYTIATNDDIIKVLCDLYKVLPESESRCETYPGGTTAKYQKSKTPVQK